MRTFWLLTALLGLSSPAALSYIPSLPTGVPVPKDDEPPPVLSEYYPDLENKDHPVHKAALLHRSVRDCLRDTVVEPERKIVLNRPDGTRYLNYVCRTRKTEQCVGDGSRDRYYDEWCEDRGGRRIKSG
jgi:hypothetical protein